MALAISGLSRLRLANIASLTHNWFTRKVVVIVVDGVTRTTRYTLPGRIDVDLAFTCMRRSPVPLWYLTVRRRIIAVLVRLISAGCARTAWREGGHRPSWHPEFTVSRGDLAGSCDPAAGQIDRARHCRLPEEGSADAECVRGRWKHAGAVVMMFSAKVAGSDIASPLLPEQATCLLLSSATSARTFSAARRGPEIGRLPAAMPCRMNTSFAFEAAAPRS